MTIHFFIKYHTSFGESIFITGDHPVLGNGDTSQAVPLVYYNDVFWHAEIDFSAKKRKGEKSGDLISYAYYLKDTSGIKVFEGEIDRYLEFNELQEKSVCVIDTWNPSGEIKNVFYTQAFNKVLLPKKQAKEVAEIEDYTHEFRVKAPLLTPGQTVVLLGSTKSLHHWDKNDPVFLDFKNNWFVGRLKMDDNEWPATYKYAVYDLKEESILFFEEGENRILYKKKEEMTLFQDGFVKYSPELWKGGGVSIPVFSLRSDKGFGVGEFADLKRMVDWAKKTGLKLIQILPVNDTIANKDWGDSYPYSAISAFALHPIYINLDAVAGKKFESILKPHHKKQVQLNQSSTVEYEQVMDVKMMLLRKLFSKKKEAFKMDSGFQKFFNENKDWLLPYAAFCYLRDKYKSPDFSTWKSNAIFDASAIQKLVSPAQKHYDQILFFYFVQYHLHVQLKEAADYASTQNVVLKGDIPIGIYRYSCDAWVSPSLYNMEWQAGAPPDDFAVKGQNWGFPTYNWDKMKEDDFRWWRRRFEQMNAYFNAFRIDHILGFFRIWSIPINAVEGLLGRFVPAIPVDISEFEQNQIHFNYARFCLPFITSDIVTDLFGDRAEEVKSSFLEIIGEHQYHLKDFVGTQRKVEAYFSKKNDPELKQGLFDLISNILLIEEEDSGGTKFHFRIDIEKTSSFSHLDRGTQQRMKDLYLNYFYYRQDEFWKKEAMEKLPALKRSTNMLIFGEDLGMVPHCVPEVMSQLAILSLEIERMPKKSGAEFFHPKDAPYLSTVTPATHDMSTIRGWWKEDREVTQRFYNYMLGHYGEAPEDCAPWINKEVLIQHFYSPAMWCIIQIQDLFGMDENIRREDPQEERINIPSNPHHHWKYRMHISLERLLKETAFNGKIRKYIMESGRLT